ncbi:rhamnolipids biosynthesis 3-oxoacyl-(acyl-carrier-protein) reductase [Colletotrichum tamarilloi]|uniref:Rhamnolipids biosynthesis 3-oxoacyl-(Acyl-carrier-protein) reductase n=1 Tax=Colletotrichum tamarilloi TaxID=1209934 RepID=A0ABQ9RCA6_9PEZI|nr:rhamnolipids biosynthesis 3-oxoacyl-(acyl-carrier-protein) reductase [Colletotrichum tamarilloi]KAK1500623.1 rhamnolipids biosynthesis 3-oxoacyl-(acyl-carrier-protein) reductase [Colletotrichum tamarilloi]
MSELKDFGSTFSLRGKTALVTGGSRGLGLHMATAFLLSGCSHVIITARKLEGEQGISQAIDKLNRLPNTRGKAIGISANVADSKDIVRLVGEVKNIVGEKGLNILVCNAGAAWGSKFEDAPPSSSVKILDLNVRGVFELVQKFLPLLEKAASEHDPARVLTVSSTAGGNVPHVGEHGTIMYAASKAAANHLGRNFAVELGPKNITSNIIAPGFFPSKLAQGLINNLGGIDELSRGNPLGRLGEPDDIAGVAVFLCSRAAKYVNGVVIEIDGGARLVAGRQSKL